MRKLKSWRALGFAVILAHLLPMGETSLAEADQTPAIASYSWQQPQAKVLSNGGLEWAPQSFVYEKGDSLRYIDFEGGDDSKDGLTPQTAWKHHPWDAFVTGTAKACKGIQTYVFKGGVVYRGTFKATESGEPGNPIRLTRDPNWGTGEAAIYGSLPIAGGWKQADAESASDIPDPEHVWYIDLEKLFAPQPDTAKFAALWQIDGANVQRMHIARMPKYDLSDPDNPLANWPTWAAYDKRTHALSSPFLKHLGSERLLDTAVFWTEGGFLMASATKTDMHPGTYDPGKGSVVLDTWVRGLDRASQVPIHFMVENVRKFLSAPGEFYYEANAPNAGRLYIYPYGGVDPNHSNYEAAQASVLLTIAGQHDIDISGLEFRYNDPDDGSPPESYITEGSPTPCIAIFGSCSNITIKNCRFYYVGNAIFARSPIDDKGNTASAVMDNIIISDNDVQHAERGGAITLLGGSAAVEGASYCQLKHADVLRNKVIDTGFRHGYCTWSSVPAIDVSFPETAEIAGNVVDTTFGNGIITFGGKSSGATGIVPLTRILVHDNLIENSMLDANDYGGLEHFQGGPVYIYNNIVRNCVGNRTLGMELGYSLYLDGGFKCYCFNNILSGKVKADQPDYYNNCGYFMVFGFLNQFFNNTIFHFHRALDGSSGNRSNILGNVMVDCKDSFIGQNRPGDVSMLGGGDTGDMGRTGIPTMAYDSNVFFGTPKVFGTVAGISNAGAGNGAPVETGDTLEELRDKLQAQKCRLAGIGWTATALPLVDAAHGNYCPVANSGVDHRGVKYFVPWALAREVGEWNFYKNTAHPEAVLGEGFYMTDEYLNRNMYYFLPRNDLTVTNCTADNYVTGPLEDWIDGALSFDGRDRVATLSHAEMTKTMSYPGGKKTGPMVYDGAKRETLDMAGNNFLIEIVFMADPGQTGGVLVSKLADSGYALALGADGCPFLKLQAGTATASISSPVKVNDGKWHHLIAEVDRAGARGAIYIDGKMADPGTLG